MTNPLFVQIAGDGDVVLVVPGRGAFGPFPTAQALAEGKEALLQVGVEIGRCEELPLRKVVSQL